MYLNHKQEWYLSGKWEGLSVAEWGKLRFFFELSQPYPYLSIFFLNYV